MQNDVMKYLEDKTLDEVTGFIASMQVNLDSGTPVFIGLRHDALSIFSDEGKQYFFDLEGRAWRLSALNYNYQRGLSHQGLFLQKKTKEEGGGFKRRKISYPELHAVCKEMWEVGTATLQALLHTDPQKITVAKPDYEQARNMLEPILKRVEHYTPKRLADEAERFSEVYQPIPVLPPDHYRALVVQATEGCPFNTCTFCALYREVSFRVRGVDEFERHIKNVLEFHGEGVRRRSTVFLGQANAISIPQKRLVTLLKGLNNYITIPPSVERPVRPSHVRRKPLHFTGIGAFIDGFTGVKKSVEDYRELRELGLDRVYLGVESGSANILRWIEKPAQPDQMLETLARLRKAGVNTDIILIVGIGGNRFADEHIKETIEFIKKSPLTSKDRIYLSELVEYSDAPYSRRMEKDSIPRLLEVELKKQMNMFKREIKKLGLQPVPYRVDPFVY